MMKSLRDPRSLVARLGSPSAVKAGRRQATAGERGGNHRRRGSSLLKDKAASSATKRAKAKANSTKKKPKKTPQPKKPNLERVRRGGTPKKQAVQTWSVPNPQVAERLDALPPSLKIRMISTAFVFVAVVIAGRAMQLQLIDGERYRLRAVGQGTSKRTIIGKRGRILDRHGVELANSVDAESVYANRGEVPDQQRVTKILSTILDVAPKAIAKRLEGRGFGYLARRISPSKAKAVRDADLEGIGMTFERRRTYGNVKLAAHVLGFVNVDGVGLWGIEQTMQSVLEGKNTQVSSIRDALRRAVWLEGFDTKMGKGDDVVLTIDRQVQYTAEEVLESTVKEHNASAGVAIVMDSPSGELLALASYPSFNPNNLSGSHPEDWRNRAVGSIYEPGSTTKIVTLATALELGKVSLEEKIYCEDGVWRIANRRIRDANHSFGDLTVEEVFYRSSNIGAAKIGLKVGKNHLYKYFRKFGFGSKTGIKLPAESAGSLKHPSGWYDVDLANISFGQGLAATPLQIVQAANVIANDGLLVRPSIIRSVTGRDPPLSSHTVVERVISARTARQVKRAMSKVTAPGGTALKASVPGFLVAGKTGTAQKYDLDIRAYSREKYVASFVGFVPAESPRVTILVLIDEPKKAIYGGPVAGPAFREIAIDALVSKGLYAAEPTAEAWFGSPSRASTVRDDPEAAQRGDPEHALERVATELTADVGVSGLSGFAPSLAEGLSAQARDILEEPLPPKETSPRTHRARGKIMPDLRGLSLGQALDKCEALTLEPKIMGTGLVYAQQPRPSARVGSKDTCELHLRQDSWRE